MLEILKKHSEDPGLGILHHVNCPICPWDVPNDAYLNLNLVFRHIYANYG